MWSVERQVRQCFSTGGPPSGGKGFEAPKMRGHGVDGEGEAVPPQQSPLKRAAVVEDAQALTIQMKGERHFICFPIYWTPQDDKTGPSSVARLITFSFCHPHFRDGPASSPCGPALFRHLQVAAAAAVPSCLAAHASCPCRRRPPDLLRGAVC